MLDHPKELWPFAEKSPFVALIYQYRYYRIYFYDNYLKCNYTYIFNTFFQFLLLPVLIAARINLFFYIPPSEHVIFLDRIYCSTFCKCFPFVFFICYIICFLFTLVYVKVYSWFFLNFGWGWTLLMSWIWINSTYQYIITNKDNNI